MSDISVRQVQASPDRIGISSTRPVSPDIHTDADSKQIREKEVEETKKVQDDARFENVISVSEHGDTVQVSNEGFSKLEEDEELGRIIVKSENTDEVEADSRKEIVDTSAKSEPVADLKSDAAVGQEKEQSDTVSTSINSYSGYTDSQLEQLYLRGEISKFDYDQEIESREAQREELKEDGKEFTNQMAKNIADTDDAARTSDEIKKAFSADASDTLSAGVRIDMIRAMENTDLNQNH